MYPGTGFSDFAGKFFEKFLNRDIFLVLEVCVPGMGDFRFWRKEIPGGVCLIKVRMRREEIFLKKRADNRKSVRTGT